MVLFSFSVFISRVRDLASSKQFPSFSIRFCIQACEELHDQVAIGIASYIFLCIYADGDGTAAFAVTDANTPSSAVGITAPTVLHFTEK